jgi:hypothetical protein
MKTKIIFISAILLLVSEATFAQSKNAPQSIVSKSAVIKKYYDKKELIDMPKGELLELCIERIGVLTKTLPYVSLATLPGATMTDYGIPNNSEYRKVFETQDDNTKNYLESTTDFQRKILPYSDKGDLIKAILFYENILKSLHEFKEI